MLFDEAEHLELMMELPEELPRVLGYVLSFGQTTLDIYRRTYKGRTITLVFEDVYEADTYCIFMRNPLPSLGRGLVNVSQWKYEKAKRISKKAHSVYFCSVADYFVEVLDFSRFGLPLSDYSTLPLALKHLQLRLTEWWKTR